MVKAHQVTQNLSSSFSLTNFNTSSELTDRDRAISAANKAAQAYYGWSSTLPTERRSLLLKAADNIERHSLELKQIAAEEVGSKVSWLDSNIETAAKLLRYAASLATQIDGEILATDYPKKTSMACRQSVGVCLGMASWNAPIILAVRAIAMPLACGNTVILKASELCPETHKMIGRVITEAGLPDNVLTVVTNELEEADQVVEALIAHPAIRRINFTGSTRVGRVIAKLSARYLKRCLLELSGKSPFIVLDDANVEAAVDAAIYGSFVNQGQLCMATEKVIVQDSIADAFITCFVTKAKVLKSSVTADPNHKLGPLINIESGKRIQALIDDAIEKGAELLCGGKVNGVFLDATIIDNVTPSMRIYSEECFGPLAQIVRCYSDEDALTIANDTEYGLSAAVFSKDTSRALNIARKIESGICHINSSTVADEAQAPFGGMKSSGYGRFGSKSSIDEFTELRWITVAQDGSGSPPI